MEYKYNAMDVVQKVMIRALSMSDYSGTDDSTKTKRDAIQDQSPTIDGWICPNCWNHRGGVKCKKNVFIAFVGANMSRCYLFDDKPRRPKDMR
jgi:hypothetical protein